VHRCVVPSRASSTSDKIAPGTVAADFIPKFQEYRKKSFVSGAPVKRLTGSPEKNREAYHLCTACEILKSGKISVGDQVKIGDSVSLREKVQTRTLSRQNVQKLVDRTYAIREMQSYLYWVLKVLIFLLPASLSTYIVTRECPDCVRKPKTDEILLGVGQLLLVLFILYWLLW
jgi:hypothetical protein